MFPIAQTNVQLFNQLRHAGMSADNILIVRRAYYLAMRLYSGHFQADGKPFVSHATGVASIVAHAGMPAEIVAAACIHNVYGNADFGDGRKHCVTPYRRQFVRKAVGPEVELLIFRFRNQRLKRERIKEIHQEVEKLNTVDRQFVVMDLADILEKYADLGVLYFGENRWVTDLVDDCGELLIEIAARLEYPELSSALKEAFLNAAQESVPDILRLEPEWKYLQLVVPLSCSKRIGLVTRHKLSRFIKKIRSKQGPGR